MVYLEMNKREAKKYGQMLYDEWVKKLTKREIISLQKYKGIFNFSTYKMINSALRNSNVLRWHDDIENISNAIHKSVIDKNIICIRNASMKFIENNGMTIDSMEQGMTLVEKGFMSTYLFKPKCRFTSKLVLIIHVPAGTCGAYVNNILPWWSGNRSEYEILFDYGTKLKVLGKKEIKGRILLEVEIV